MRYLNFASAALFLAMANAHAEDLIAGKIGLQARTIVYEMPGLPPALAGRLVDALKDKFPQAEAIDGAAASEIELRAKLKKSFVLITMLNSHARILPLAALGLPMRLEDEVLHWDDFAAPAKDLRLTFVGRNPYGPGYAVVLAVGSPELFSGGDNADYSYSIANAHGLLHKGNYNEEFTPTHPDHMKLADASEDVREFFASLERIHPDPYLYVTEPQYKAMKQQTFVDLQARADHDGRVSIEDLTYLLTYAGAYIRDGHTGINQFLTPGLGTLDNRRFPPFRLEFENRRFYIDGAADPSLIGLELAAVNGVSTAVFLAPALDRCTGEFLIPRAVGLIGDQEFWMWLTNVFGKTDHCCTLKLRDSGGVESERAVLPITLAEYRKIKSTPGRKLPPKKGTQVQFFDSGKVAQLAYPSFRQNDEERKKIDEIFGQIRERKTTDLVVDLRRNGGGESSMGSYIFSYLSKTPIRESSAGRIKVSREAMASLVGNVGALGEGEFLDITNKEAVTRCLAKLIEKANLTPPRQQHPFSGRLWLLVDQHTYSAANMFTVAFHDHKLGKILGYETPQGNMTFGNPLELTLKHSGIPYRVASAEFYLSKSAAKSNDQGVLPDIPFDRKMLSPFHDEPDPELAFTVDYIQKHR